MSEAQMSNLIDRRTLIQATGASIVAGSVKVAQAAPTTGQSGGATDDLIVRKIPKGEDVLPAIGLGTFITFDLVPGARRDHLLEVTRRFWAAGGRVFDTSPLYGMAEVNVGQFASVLGINDKMFVSNKIWATGEYLADDRQAEDSLRLSRERLWRVHLPEQLPLAGKLDLADLARRYKMSGGYIRNAALRAAFLAVEEGSSLTHEHLERAIRMEFREIGKLAETGALE